ncbi:hypothetical protein B0T16DRAFT_3577 [Cercophora newfieldiana]|uniref:Uncharacterized protein n=1 Tax=Cercophora newfieldiana TaxID=92897 RepID=A0AA40CZR3_9PEZI|nr:hypothetical protein B0T16DRAFT_3577 [Cercophora newfieldiana]
MTCSGRLPAGLNLTSSMTAGGSRSRGSSVSFPVSGSWDDTDCHQSVQRLISGLPHLTALHLLYSRFHRLQPVSSCLFPRLSWRLRTLSVWDRPFQASDIRQLREDCPLLQDLGLTISRCQGDKTEADLYQLIGRSFPRLRHVVVGHKTFHRPSRYMTASCRFGGVVDPSFDEFDRECYRPGLLNGHVRLWFFNNAVDEILARSIFDAISSSKGLPSREGYVALETLKTFFIGGVYQTLPTYSRRGWASARAHLERDTQLMVAHPRRSGGCSGHKSEQHQSFQLTSARSTSEGRKWRSLWPVCCSRQDVAEPREALAVEMGIKTRLWELW